MGKSYQEITEELAKRIRLIMTDVDGTLLTTGEYVSQGVIDSITGLMASGIIVGLVSGRTIPRLERLALYAKTDGPIIAENGGTAKLKTGDELFDLGYSRQSALEVFKKLQSIFPGDITEKEDNNDRRIDVAIRTAGQTADELRKHIENIQLLDSGYMFHLLQEGVSKGRTLERLVGQIADGGLSKDEIMVFGDSLTDISLFELFPHSVMIINPGLTEEHRETVSEKAEFTSSLICGDGFIEVASRIINLRQNKG
ncbi:HAD family hydrolase [Chloroflexota bacterium]